MLNEIIFILVAGQRTPRYYSFGESPSARGSRFQKKGDDQTSDGICSEIYSAKENDFS